MPSPHIQHHSASLESLCLPQGENSPKSKAGRGGGVTEIFLFLSFHHILEDIRNPQMIFKINGPCY